MSPLSEQPEFEFGHTAFQSQQKPVIKLLRIIDPIVIHNQCLRQCAEIDQMMPVAIVPRQAGRLQGKDRSNLSIAHRREQFPKPRSVFGSRSGAPQVIIDHDNFTKLQLAGFFRQLVLPTLALPMFANLMHRRLANIDIGGTFQMVATNLVVHHLGSFRWDFEWQRS